MSDDREKRRFRRLAEQPYFKWGLTIFCVGALLILFYQMVAYYSGFKTGMATIRVIVSPFIYGFVMAYLLTPIYNLIIRKTYPFFGEKFKTKRHALTMSKIIATIISLLVLFGVVGGMLSLLIPQVIESIRGLTAILPERFDQLNDWLGGYLGEMENQNIADTINNGFSEFQDNILEFLQDKFLPGVGSFMQRLSNGLIVTIRTFLNIVVGVIACVYFLNGKETFRAQFRKLISAFFKEDRADRIRDFFAFSNKTFGGFITGKLIDSLIIGIICFVAMRILNLPYPILISTIVGVTNVIPFFGPFIGAIPSLAIIFIISPLQALYFLILIIILQQLDGNVIGPAIMGNTTGLASFWVMFAIIVGGGLFGFIGMVLGVPLFAIIYYYFGRYVDQKLKEKEMPSDTKEYINLDKYEISKEDFE